ncbi:hypothetical protein SCUCBS95973_006972 [Sporothrix curviconia]|uniref:Uncharacterized protein n=1 Tax=Sporothrix curviconia TaxID=1260050 RepID=A0ABP0CAR1_9PEZI
MSRPGRRRETIKGSWTDAEDKRLVYIVTTTSCINWSNVADEMQGRSAKQCRERWVQNLRPDLEHEPINEMEGNFIMAHVETLGKKWAEIARRLEYETGRVRSDNNVKNWYNGTVNRQTRAERRREAAGQHQHQHQHRHNITAAAAPALPRPSPSFSSSCRSRAARPTPPQQLTLAHQRDLPRPQASASDMALVSPMSANSYYGEHRHQYPSQHTHQHAAPAQQYNGPSGYPTASHPAAPYQRRPSVHQLPSLQDALRHNVPDRESDVHWSQQQQQPQPQPHYPPRLSDRRASVYTMVDSPRSDHHYVPSLMSDTGSPPSLRESPMHAPASPNTAVPPILPPLASMDVDDKDAAHGAYRSPTTMTRSWSGHSDDQYQPRALPPILMEPKLAAPRPSSSSRGPSGFALSHLLNR